MSFRRILPSRRPRGDSEERSALSSVHEDCSFDSSDFQQRRLYNNGSSTSSGSSRIAQLFRSLPSRVRRQRSRFGPKTPLSGLVGTVKSSPFQCLYWRSFRQIDKPSPCWFRAPSSVKEIVYFAACNWTVLVCSGGDTVALVNDPIVPRVAWSGRVLMTGLDGNVASSTTVRLKRAAFDAASERLYFTQTNHAGIFYARLGEIRNTVVHQPKIFVSRTKTRERFGALAVDSRQNLLICCNSKKRSASITCWSTGKRQPGESGPLAEIDCTQLLVPTGPSQRDFLSIQPHKIATFSRLDNTGPTTLVAVCDKANSAVHLFRLSLTQASSIKLEFVATAADKATSDIRRPRAVHFDPAGNLIVADDGPLHSRLQFFPMSDRGQTEAGDDQLLTSSVYRSVFAPIKCAAASLDPTTRRPFILCGVSGFMRFPGIRRFGTSGEVACFTSEVDI